MTIGEGGGGWGGLKEYQHMMKREVKTQTTVQTLQKGKEKQKYQHFKSACE